MKPPVIVIPGITATSLRDFYPPGPENLWGLPGPKDYRRVALHPDDLRYEEREPALVRTGEVFSIPYDQLVRELRHDLSASPDRPRPVYLFPYDWRQPLERLVEDLGDFAREVAGRTALLKHYHRAGYGDAPSVDLVGHSMGGLLAAGYLARLAELGVAGGAGPSGAVIRRGEAPVPVRRAVSLGTPFGGSFEAVIQIVTGTAALGGGVPSSREREMARVTPSLYHLLPRFDGALLRSDAALPDTLFQAEAWQRGVVDSIAEHIRRHGLEAPGLKAERTARARAFLQAMLDTAAAFRDRVDALRLEDAGLSDRDWLAVAGVGEETRVRLAVEGPVDDPFFNLRSLERKDEGEETGDGTVPFRSAVPPFLDPARVLAVSTSDFGYWELADRLLGRVAGLHSLMPAMNRVIKLTGTFLDGEAGQRTRAHRGLQGRRPPGVPEEAWDPPVLFR